MDEAFLTDLLECSVCLEQLDNTSKVLPCQHTFCKRCLDEIVHSHKELRCPECRILVETRVEDLPPNILLIRLLEGIKNNPRLSRPPLGEPPVPPTTLRHVIPPPSPHTPTNQFCVTTSGGVEARTLVKQIVPSLPCAKALYSYEAKDPGDLTFKKGDVIALRKRVDQNWYHGEHGGKQGFIPASYIQVVVPLPSHIPQCKALYDFRLSENDEKDCLTFSKGEMITVIRRVDENWSEGKLGERIGIFPISFVEMNVAAKALMKLSPSIQIGPSRVAPPTPNAEASQVAVQSGGTPSATESQSSTTSPSPASSSPSPGTPSSSSSSPPLPNQSPSPCPRTTHPREKRHSLSALSNSQRSPQASTAPHRHSMEILNTDEEANSISTGSPSKIPTPNAVSVKGSESSAKVVRRHSSRKERENTGGTPTNQQSCTEGSAPSPYQQPSTHSSVPTFYIALYNYKPQKEDELELRKSELYTVTEKCQDGWFKGTSLRTGLSGVFPGNYVQIAKSSGMPSQYHQQTPSVTTRAPAPTSPRPRPTGNGPPPFITATPVPVTQNDSFQRTVDWALPPPQRPPRPQLPTTTAITNTATHKPQAVTKPPSSNSPPSQTNNAWLMAWPAMSASYPNHSGSWSTPTRSPPQPLLSATVTVTPPNVAISPGTTSCGVAANATPRSEKKERKEKEKISLMKRLTSKRKSRSPPPSNYSCDNPTFVDTPTSSNQSALTVVHVRSGSCPSEALGSQPTSHKKTSSLDGNETLKSRPKLPAPLVRERFRCIVPYPPNSEYELELKLGDIVYVHKKREDGWYKGTLQRTGKTGLFPGSFVEGF